MQIVALSAYKKGQIMQIRRAVELELCLHENLSNMELFRGGSVWDAFSAAKQALQSDTDPRNRAAASHFKLLPDDDNAIHNEKLFLDDSCIHLPSVKCIPASLCSSRDFESIPASACSSRDAEGVPASICTSREYSIDGSMCSPESLHSSDNETNGAVVGDIAVNSISQACHAWLKQLPAARGTSLPPSCLSRARSPDSLTRSVSSGSSQDSGSPRASSKAGGSTHKASSES